MDVQDLRKLLEKADHKLSIFASAETLKQYNFNKKEFFDLIRDFLSDQEISKLFEYSHFQQFETWIKGEIIDIVSDENIKLQMISNDNIISSFDTYQIVDIIKRLCDTGKNKYLHNQELIEKHSLSNYELKNIISSMGDASKAEILKDKKLVTDKLHLENYQITELTKQLTSENTKRTVLQMYQLENLFMIDIISTFSNKSKLEIILEEKRFYKHENIQLLSLLDINMLSEFIKTNKNFLTEKDIKVYEIVKALDSEEQIDFVAKLEDMNLTLNEKREILAILTIEAKENIDGANLPKEYKNALSIKTTEHGGQIILDLERDLEDYRGLDNLMRINPEEFTETQKAKFIKLCDICPNLQVINMLNSFVEFTSTASEYKEAEQWIISSGYGVCNGIAKVEQYILNRVGVESEIISSNRHVFLKIKNIELPLANGETVKGNTILDPTWNLTRHRFGGIPDNFCINYEEARKHDIDIEGKDHKCHKNDEKLQDATLNLDEQSLRQLFTSVSLADKQGYFPIKALVEKSKLLGQYYEKQPDLNIKKQFLLLSKACPEFATCQDSTMNILKDILLSNENLEFNKCVVNRVYERMDKEKRPILYVYIDSDELGKKFYFADENKGEFIELSQEGFVKQFECYEKDLQRNEGLRPWEFKEQKKEDIDLSRSSGTVSIREGEER